MGRKCGCSGINLVIAQHKLSIPTEESTEGENYQVLVDWPLAEIQSPVSSIKLLGYV
jgi:hypothetical protein